MDSEAFRCFYERSAPALRSFLRYSSEDRALADDLLQETFVRLLQRDLDSLGEAECRAYLYKTAHSVLVDHFRRHRRNQRLRDALEFEPQADSGTPELPPDLGRVLAQLSPRDQKLLWLAYVERFSHAEIAEIADVAEKSVRVLLLRARKRMAAALADHGIGREEIT